jgi:hypothetical protein
MNDYIHNAKRLIITLLIFLVSLCISCNKKINLPENPDGRFFKTDNSTQTLFADNSPVKAGNIPKDTFLLYYLRNNSTILLDMSENVREQNIWYKNFDTKEINYGDAEEGTDRYQIYLFQNGLFYGLEKAQTIYGNLSRRYKEFEIHRDADGEI